MATMEENIKETPERIKGIVEARKEIFKEVVKPEYTRVVISGSGSSYHAGVGAQEFMLKYMQIPVEVLYPFQVEDYIFSEPETTLFIGVSQNEFKCISCNEACKGTWMQISLYVRKRR